MIEAIVAYIEQQGFTVKVFPGCLFIYKDIDEDQLCYTWAISRLDLSYVPKEVLLQEADRHLEQIEAYRQIPRRFIAMTEEG